MDKSGEKDFISKLWQPRMAIIEVGIAETNEEAWFRHLAAHPEDFYANIRIFNRKKNVQEETGLVTQGPAKLEE